MASIGRVWGECEEIGSEEIGKNQNGSIVEIDISKYFNTIPHAALEEILQRKIIDKGFLKF